MKSLKTSHILLVVLVIIGVALRLWRLPELFHFTYDEEIIAFVGKRMFVNLHIPLIGGVTPMHIHLAPYFYWLSGVILFFSRLNPLGWGVAAALLAGITMMLLYLAGSRIFGSKVGIIAIFLYAFSFNQNIFDRHYWGLSFNGILSLLVFLSLYELSTGNHRFAYLLAGALAFGFHTDPSTIVLFVLTVLAWVTFKIRLPGQVLVKAGLIFLLSFFPLLVFDLRHDFSNSRGIFQYIDEVRAGRHGVVERNISAVLAFVPATLARYLYIPGKVDLAREYSYCPAHALSRTQSEPLWILGLVLFITGFASVIQKSNQSEKLGISLILQLFISVYLGVFVYGVIFKGDLFDHYLATLPPLFYLLTGFMISKLSKNYNWIIWVVGILFIFVNMKQTLAATHSFGYADKTNAVKWAIAATGNDPFSLDVIGDCFRYNGYRYLFYFNGKEPVKSYVDANFTHLYDRLPAKTHPRQLVVITNPDFPETPKFYQEYISFTQKLIQRKQFGAIEVMLVDNSNLDFTGKF